MLSPILVEGMSCGLLYGLRQFYPYELAFGVELGPFIFSSHSIRARPIDPCCCVLNVGSSCYVTPRSIIQFWVIWGGYSHGLSKRAVVSLYGLGESFPRELAFKVELGSMSIFFVKSIFHAVPKC